MLSRYSQLDPDTGVYHKPKNPNVVYGSLTYVWIIQVSGRELQDG